LLEKILQAKQSCAVVESVKAASDIYAPVAGTILVVNSYLTSQPEMINTNPYDSWFFKISPQDPNEINSLLNA
jgi:glycine cleavage system H protein